jgi:predicted adenine nucleotide alpha hydrolase (AANH) superfamily ATPase
MPFDEYEKRLADVRRLLSLTDGADLIVGEYDNENFLSMVKGLENCKEGQKRCEICIRQRLEKTASYAKKHGFDLFSTTLTISPHKNAEYINNAQTELEKVFGVKSLPLNLKKNGGYLRSIELSKKNNLYRQNYCGCKFDISNEADF